MAAKIVNHAALLTGKAVDLVIGEREVPTPGPKDVVVRNHCVAINPLDWRRQAWGYETPSFPIVMGQDISGEVVRVGSEVTWLKPGDHVAGTANGFSTRENDRGAFQEFSLTMACCVAKIPTEIPFEQGATLGTNVSTAAMIFQDLWAIPKPDGTRAPVPNSPGILIWGGASSNGFYFVQYAVMMGFKVFATASEKNHDYLRSIGATAVVDYHLESAEQEILDAAMASGTAISYAIDVTFDREVMSRILKVMAASGSAVKRVCSLMPKSFWPKDIPEGIEVEEVNGAEISGRRQDLGYWVRGEIEGWLEKGTIVPGKYLVIDGGLNGIQSAMNQLHKGGSVEKLIVKLI